MNLNDYYSRSLTEAKTTSIKGRILESTDKYIVVIWCNCVHHDPPNHPCKCMEGTKLIIDKSDIVGDIVTIESNEKDKLSEFLVKSDANIIREEKTVVKANNFMPVFLPILGPFIADFCRRHPEHCKGKDPKDPGVTHFIPVLAGILGGMAAGFLADRVIDIFDKDCTTTTTNTVGANGETITTTTKTCK
nr:hypothetical protein [uncultured Psychroserpens sp.]